MANEMVSMYYQNLITILTKNILETEKRINILTLQDTALHNPPFVKVYYARANDVKSSKKKKPCEELFTSHVV